MDEQARRAVLAAGAVLLRELGGADELLYLQNVTLTSQRDVGPFIGWRSGRGFDAGIP